MPAVRIRRSREASIPAPVDVVVVKVAKPCWVRDLRGARRRFDGPFKAFRYAEMIAAAAHVGTWVVGNPARNGAAREAFHQAADADDDEA